MKSTSPRPLLLSWVWLSLVWACDETRLALRGDATSPPEAAVLELDAGQTAPPDVKPRDDVPDVGVLPAFENVEGFLCDRRYVVQREGAQLVVPYCANVDLAQPGAYGQVDRVVFSVHGLTRIAARYYERMVAAANAAGVANRVVIVAPQFLVESDLAENGLDASYVFWTGWISGSRSRSTDANPRPFRVSSYEIVDEMLTRLRDDFSFPNARDVVVAGHSAGGQFVNRFAAASRVEFGAEVRVRYVVANPSSYLYFSPKRWRAGTRHDFAVPEAAAIEACPTYDDYRYGLRDLYAYLRPVGAQGLIDNYLARDVVVLLGERDNDPDAESLGRSCEAMIQGSQRYERGVVYRAHLLDEFAERAAAHPFVTVPEVGHSSAQMFRSPCGLRSIFDFGDEGTCPGRLR